MRSEGEIRKTYDHFHKINESRFWNDLSVGIEEALEWVLYEDVDDLYTEPSDDVDLPNLPNWLKTEIEKVGPEVDKLLKKHKHLLDDVDKI